MMFGMAFGSKPIQGGKARSEIFESYGIRMMGCRCRVSPSPPLPAPVAPGAGSDWAGVADSEHPDTVEECRGACLS